MASQPQLLAGHIKSQPYKLGQVKNRYPGRGRDLGLEQIQLHLTERARGGKDTMAPAAAASSSNRPDA